MRSWKVVVAGLGTVGMPTAEYIAGVEGVSVYGYDIVMKKSEKFPTTTNWDELPHEDIDVYVIAVWTGLRDGKPDLSALEDVLKKIARANPDALISVESTVPVGALRRFANELGLRRLVHVPHRYWAGDPERHGVRQLRVLGALNDESLAMGVEFYQHLDIPLHIVSSLEVAEMTKIAENAYRFVQIAFAEELRMICESLSLDFEEVRRAANTKWNIEILEARDGIGGMCLPKDIRYLRHAAKLNTPLLNGAIEADESYKLWIRKKD